MARFAEKPFTSLPRPVASGFSASPSTLNIFTLTHKDTDKFLLNSRVLAEIREIGSCLVSSRNCFTVRCQPSSSRSEIVVTSIICSNSVASASVSLPAFWIHRAWWRRGEPAGCGHHLPNGHKSIEYSGLTASRCTSDPSSQFHPSSGLCVSGQKNNHTHHTVNFMNRKCRSVELRQIGWFLGNIQGNLKWVGQQANQSCT